MWPAPRRRHCPSVGKAAYGHPVMLISRRTSPVQGRFGDARAQVIGWLYGSATEGDQAAGWLEPVTAKSWEGCSLPIPMRKILVFSDATECRWLGASSFRKGQAQASVPSKVFPRSADLSCTPNSIPNSAPIRSRGLEPIFCREFIRQLTADQAGNSGIGEKLDSDPRHLEKLPAEDLEDQVSNKSFDSQSAWTTNDAVPRVIQRQEFPGH
jgi:hypothetical protein